MSPLVLTNFTAVNAMGHGRAEIWQSLLAGKSGLRACDFERVELNTYVGMADGLESPLPAAYADFDCRNNRLALAALTQDGFDRSVIAARARHGADRVAVLLGTSTSGILETEHAYQRCDSASVSMPADYNFEKTHNLYATTAFVRDYFGLQGPASMISTACSSSAKVFAQAWRMLTLGLCDAAVVGGVDSLCRNTLYGFSALELVAPGPCRPCAADRDGITIGEAAGFALLERHQADDTSSGVQLLGFGESSDAYHMSTPRPDGSGAVLAMQRALAGAGLAPADIDYINLHGTASLANDSMEDKAVTAVFGRETACSSTKGWTGHALGAAGITEAVISALCLQHGFLPGCLNTAVVDPSFTSRVLLTSERRSLRQVLSNSFGFGGSNCSLIFGVAP